MNNINNELNPRFDPKYVILGKLQICNPDGGIRWDNFILFNNDTRQYHIADGARYSLFPNSEELGIGSTMGNAIDDFIAKEEKHLYKLG